MNLICLDTNIMIWGFLKNARTKQQPNILRATSLIDTLEKQRAKIIIPTIVLGELLVGIPPELHLSVANRLDRHFQITPFDSQCAQQYAVMFGALNKNDEVIPEERTSRAVLKADCMIVATAIVHGADCIYSHDKHFVKLSQGLIEIKHLPEAAAQLEMFDQPHPMP